MSATKKDIRQAFRIAVLARDNYRCAMCGFKPEPAKINDELDPHHITDRNDLPGGGYVIENGITLCSRPGGCHEKAEAFHRGEPVPQGYAPEDLYKRIGSNYEIALAATISRQ